MQHRDPILTVVIVYYSRFGSVERLAQAIAEGARKAPNVDVQFLKVEDQPIEQRRPGENEDDVARRRAVVLNRLAVADALIVGSPSYFGSMASPLKRLFEDVSIANPSPTDRTRPWRHHLFRDKVGGAFASSATIHGGNEATLQSILTMLMHLGLVLVTPGQQEPILENEAAPYGATMVSGVGGDLPPTELELGAARDFGERVVQITRWLLVGRMEWFKHAGEDAYQQILGDMQ